MSATSLPDINKAKSKRNCPPLGPSKSGKEYCDVNGTCSAARIRNISASPADEPMHPQLRTQPERNDSPRTLLVLPQSHAHFHATRFLPLGPIWCPSLSITVKRPKRFPIISLIKAEPISSPVLHPQLLFGFPFNEYGDTSTYLPQSHLHLYFCTLSRDGPRTNRCPNRFPVKSSLRCASNSFI